MQREHKMDTDTARKANLKLYRTKDAGWLNINAGAIIALLTVIFTFALWFTMLSDGVKGINDNLLFAINSGASMAIGFILSYYFGSSSSKDNESISNYQSSSNLSNTNIDEQEKTELK
jgi:predicted phage tail protein